MGRYGFKSHGVRWLESRIGLGWGLVSHERWGYFALTNANSTIWRIRKRSPFDSEALISISSIDHNCEVRRMLQFMVYGICIASQGNVAIKCDFSL